MVFYVLVYCSRSFCRRCSVRERDTHRRGSLALFVLLCTVIAASHLNEDRSGNPKYGFYTLHTSQLFFGHLTQWETPSIYTLLGTALFSVHFLVSWDMWLGKTPSREVWEDSFPLGAELETNIRYFIHLHLRNVGHIGCKSASGLCLKHRLLHGLKKSVCGMFEPLGWWSKCTPWSTQTSKTESYGVS